MPLCQLIYYSENQLDTRKRSLLSQLIEIQQVSNRNNSKKEITGALICDDLWFIQLLEGERMRVLDTYERLKDDERHARLTLALFTDIEERMFGNWRMAVFTRTHMNVAAFRPYLRDERLQPAGMQGMQIRNFIADVARVGAGAVATSVA